MPCAPAHAWVTEILGLTDLPEPARLLLVHWWGRASEFARCEIIVPAARGITPFASVVADARTILPGHHERTVARYISALRARGLAILDGRVITLVPPSEAVPVEMRKRSANGVGSPAPKKVRKRKAKSTESTTEPAAPPERDLAREVFDYLCERIDATRKDLGMTPRGKTVFSDGRRGKINARIKDYGGGDEGVAACRKVIQVDEYQCRIEGADSKSWNYWNPDTPFLNAKNFEQRLNRWRPNGRHAVGGSSSPRGPWSNDPNYGAPERHGQTLDAYAPKPAPPPSKPNSLFPDDEF